MTRDELRDQMTDAIAVRCLLEGEARGEPIIGQIGVLSVVRNRLKAGRFGRTLAAVCLQKWQFSCFWEDSPNTDRVYALAERLLAGEEDPNPQLAWLTAGLITEALEDDPTFRSCHYVTSALLRAKPPFWAKGHAPAVTLGSHAFFAGIA